MSLQPGTRLGNYEVLAELGSGGMGEVYKARDLKLGREVAIKVLPQEMAADAQRLRRFEQEARAASALNHPNIVTIYEISEHEGTPYIAMEYVEGKSLREILSDGPLPNDKLIRYATQMAEGLAKAHQAGIVHRDLKPENIVISSDGYVKILDFGLAKLLPDGDVGAELSTLAKDTTPGAILGTVGYMSPEQAKGESAGFRSDQFSLGAILYELATGDRAFKRDSSAQTLAAIIEHEPRPVTVSNPSVPGRLASVIDRCLSKEPDERYESTWAIAKQIREETFRVAEPRRERYPLAVAAVGGLLAVVAIMLLGVFVSDIREFVFGEADIPVIESIAVLPLENLSGDPDQEYFADGMTDALINELAQVRELRVVSRTSVMQFKDTEKTIPEIGEALGVDAILEGSVLRSEDRIGLTTQLIDAHGDSQLWSGSYERRLEDVLSLRKEVARAIVTEIRVVLSPEERAVLESAAPVNAEAYDACQKGMFFLEKFTEDGVRKAIEYAQQALEHDPDFAFAYFVLAAGYGTLTYVSPTAPTEYADEAREAARKALSLDETLGEAHAALAWIRATYDWDWSGAEASYLRAQELRPVLPRGPGGYTHYLAAIGRFDESIRRARSAQRVEPINPSVLEDLAFALYMSRRFDQCIEESRAALELYPNHMYLQTRLARALAESGELDEAIDVAQKADRLAGADPDRRALLGRLYAIAGRRQEALAILEQFEADAMQGYVPPTAIARIHVGLGNAEHALELLEEAYEVRDGDMYMLKTWPVWDPLRSDPRFQDLLRRMNFPER